MNINKAVETFLRFCVFRIKNYLCTPLKIEAGSKSGSHEKNLSTITT